jgi:chromosomal replication initiator protein
VVDGVLRIDLPMSPCNTIEAAVSNGESVDLGCFVAGSENRIPVLVLEKLLTGEADFSTQEWANPLVLIGPTGSGKSLLARGIARRWLPILGPDQVAYFTAIDWVRSFAAAREDHELPEFRSRLAGLQLLVIEDLHKLPAKLAVQHALRDVLDQLAESGTEILCTSQVAPSAQLGLEAGLCDRLMAGLLLWLNHPGTAARLELLRLAAVERGTKIDNRELRTLAENTAGPASQLMRALRELEVAPLVGSNPGSQRVAHFSKEYVAAKEIVAVVARYFGVTQAALRGPARRKSLVFARSVAVYLIRTLTHASYSQIGKELGRRDHSTIMHSMESIQLAVATDPATKHAVEELRRIALAA